MTEDRNSVDMYPMRDLLLEQESEDFRALPDLTQAILSRQYLFLLQGFWQFDIGTSEFLANCIPKDLRQILFIVPVIN